MSFVWQLTCLFLRFILLCRLFRRNLITSTANVLTLSFDAPVLFKTVLLRRCLFFLVQIELIWFCPELFLNLVFSQRNIFGCFGWFSAYFIPFNYFSLMCLICCIRFDIIIVAMFDRGVKVGDWSSIVDSCFWIVEVDTIVGKTSLFPLLDQLVSSFRLLIETYYWLRGLLRDPLSLLGGLDLELGQSSFLA